MATDPIGALASSARASRASPSRPSRLRERSLLLNPLPVVAATLAAFVLAFGGLTVRLVTGHDTAVGTLASVSGRTPSAGAAALSTRASGATAGAAATGGSSSAAGAGPTAGRLVTSTSGAPGAGGRASALGDDGG